MFCAIKKEGEMVDSLNSNEIRDSNSVSGVSSTDDLLNKSNSSKNLAQVLLKESTNYSSDSQAKAQKAREYIKVSDDLKKKAMSVRAKADRLRSKKLSAEERAKEINEIINMLPDDLKLLVPLNASPEVLEKIAHELESRAKDFRKKADDLLKDSEQSDNLAKQLKEQAGLINKKDFNFSDLHLKSASAHNQGLLLVLKKLGIAKLDAEYKEQIAYSQGKSQ